jgi:hypothetical protein
VTNIFSTLLACHITRGGHKCAPHRCNPWMIDTRRHTLPSPHGRGELRISLHLKVDIRGRRGCDNAASGRGDRHGRLDDGRNSALMLDKIRESNGRQSDCGICLSPWASGHGDCLKSPSVFGETVASAILHLRMITSHLDA